MVMVESNTYMDNDRKMARMDHFEPKIWTLQQIMQAGSMMFYEKKISVGYSG